MTEGVTTHQTAQSAVVLSAIYSTDVIAARAMVSAPSCCLFCFTLYIYFCLNYICRWTSWAVAAAFIYFMKKVRNDRPLTHGRVRAGPSLQLGTLSTRIALYSTLARLAWRAYARRPCTHSRAWRPSAARQKRS